MSNKTPNNWVQYYRNVAEMRLNIEVIADDLNYDGKVLYAVDNDVVIFFADPVENTQYVDKEGGVYYSNDMGMEELKSLEGLAISLSEYIFLNGLVSDEKNSCLLFPTPMAKEFLGKYDEILFKARIEKDIVTPDQLKIEELTKFVDDCKESGGKLEKSLLITHLIDNHEDLVRYLSPYDYSTNIGKLQRFAIIGRKEKLRNIEIIETIESLIIPDESEIRSSEEYDRWDDWFRTELKSIEDNKKLSLQESSNDTHNDFKNKKREEINIVNDVNTLTLISLLNKYFKKNKKKIKILYITGDSVAKAILNSKSVAKEATKLNIEHDFLRYPKQFVPLVRFNNTKQVNRNDKLKQLMVIRESVDEFLNLFSVNSKRSEHHKEDYYLENLKKVVNDTSDNYIQEIINPYRDQLYTEQRYQKLQNNIKKLTSSLAIINKREVSYMASSLAESLLSDEDIYKRLQDTQEDAFSDVTDTLRTFGTLEKITKQFKKLIAHLDSLSSNDIDGIARGPVSLRRSPEKGGDEFFEKIHNRVYKKQWNSLYKQIEKSSLYTHYLSVALIAADANEWKEARKYCELALKKLEKKSVGNEGHYFLAIALRHSCEDFGDYSRAIDALNEFKRIWNERNFKDRQDHRFESERLALATAYFNYERFYDNWADDRTESDKPKLRKTWDSLDALADGINSTDKEGIINHRIRRQIYSNQCCLFIIDRYVNNKEVIRDYEGNDAYASLLSLSKTDNFRSSYFINFLISFMEWNLNNEDIIIWKKALKNTRVAFQKRKVPYEENKYEYFEEKLIEYGDRKSWEE